MQISRNQKGVSVSSVAPCSELSRVLNTCTLCAASISQSFLDGSFASVQDGCFR